MKKDIAKKVCKRLIHFLNIYNIPFIFSSGSLLGVIREGDIISNDTDIDLCTYLPYIPILYNLKQQLLEHELYISREQKGDKLLKSIKKKTYSNKKIFGVKINQKKLRYLWRISFNGMNIGERKDDDIEQLRWIDIYGMHWFPLTKQIKWCNININIPLHTKKLLTMIYGNWETPIDRKKFKRPESAYLTQFCTTLYKSNYGKKYRDIKYPYINENDCVDFTTIEEFYIFNFVKDIVKNSINTIA